MRIFKLTIVLVITVVCFLALLHFKISFGIALFASMALMAFGINYVRKDDASETDTAYNAEQETGMLTLYQGIDDCDGFFLCRMEKQA